MGILNHTSDGLYNMVAVLYRAVARLEPMSAEALVALCTAGIETGKSGQPRMRDALARWLTLGLFETTREGLVRIAPGCEPAATAGDDQALTQALRRAVLRIALQPANVGSDLWSTEGSADLARGLAWWMAQDAWAVNTSITALMPLETDQLPPLTELRIVNNNVRMERLRDWAVFLGFAWFSARSLELDPTLAVDQVLDEVLPVAGEAVAATDFLLALAQSLPVLDGGQWRIEVEAQLRTDVWHATPPGWVSSTLARALRRLDYSGRLRLVSRADAGTAVRVPGRGGTADRPWAEFTHVVRTEPAL
jgi:hypothetical protein